MANSSLPCKEHIRDRVREHKGVEKTYNEILYEMLEAYEQKTGDSN